MAQLGESETEETALQRDCPPPSPCYWLTNNAIILIYQFGIQAAFISFVYTFCQNAALEA
jgi:hypothetical protein